MKLNDTQHTTSLPKTTSTMDSRFGLVVSILLLSATVIQSAPQNTHQNHVREPKHKHKPEAKHKQETEKKVENAKHKASTPWQVCFYTNWAQYRGAPAGFVPEDIDPNLCTHIFFAFSNMDGNELIPYEANDYEMYARINDLKLINPNLKTTLAVGGWTFGTAKMTLMMSSKQNRTEFIQSAIQTARAHNFNGIDLDFEYPAARGSPAIDKAQFTCLVEEMRAAFDLENPTNPLELSSGVAAGMDAVIPGYDIKRICNSLDRVNLMSYDFFGKWDATANPHSPLYDRVGQSPQDSQKTVEYAANYWVANGCPRNKINIGMATYGRSFTLTNPLQNQVGDPIDGAGTPGRFTGAEGILAYYEICESIYPAGNVATHPEHMVPYGSNGDQWVGFEDIESLELKAQWLMDNGFGGYMIWNLDFDDFKGLFCAQGNYPLITALHNKLVGYVVPDDDMPAPDPIPPPDQTFCTGRENGWYSDMYSCSRCYQCVGETTSVVTCPEGQVMDPADLPNCRYMALMSEEEICLECYEFCDCDTLVTPLRVDDEL